MDTIKNIFYLFRNLPFYILHSPARRSARACTFAFLLCHPERSGERHVSRAVERVLRGAYRKTNAFAVFGTARRSIQDPSTDARDDKDDFCFQRSFDCASIGAPLRMTERGSLRLASLDRDDRGASRMRKRQKGECSFFLM